jgi:hypothetical protein
VILTLIFVGLGLLSFAAKVVALVDAVRQRPDAFVATGKRTKTFWVAILGVAVVLQVLTGIDNPIGPLGLNLLGVVAAIVYLVDVRPAIREITGGSGPGRIDRGSW